MPSFVWKHFSKSKDGKATVCAHCSASVVFKACNTSSMSHHLLAKHGVTAPESRKRKASEENDDETQPAPKKKASQLLPS